MKDDYEKLAKDFDDMAETLADIADSKMNEEDVLAGFRDMHATAQAAKFEFSALTTQQKRATIFAWLGKRRHGSRHSESSELQMQKLPFKELSYSWQKKLITDTFYPMYEWIHRAAGDAESMDLVELWMWRRYSTYSSKHSQGVKKKNLFSDPHVLLRGLPHLEEAKEKEITNRLKSEVPVGDLLELIDRCFMY